MGEVVQSDDDVILVADREGVGKGELSFRIGHTEILGVSNAGVGRGLLGGSLTAVADVVVNADSDNNGSGDIILKIGGAQRGRLTNAGDITLRSTQPITTVSGSYTIPAGSDLVKISKYGSLLAGLNPDLTDETGATSLNSQMVDFGFIESGLRLYTRSIRIAELGDPPDLILARWGPDNGYPYATKTGTNTGESLGAIRWMPAVNAFGATPDVTPGGSLQADSGSIAVKTVEVPRDTTGGGVYAVGATMLFSIAPIGGVSSVVAQILSTGHLLAGPRTVASATDSATFQAWSEATGVKVAVFRAFAGQTADVFDIQDSTGASYFRVAANAQMFFDQAATQITFRNQSAAGNIIMQTQVAADTNVRWALRASGQQEWGSGSAATDININRASAGLLVVKALGSVATKFAVAATATNTGSNNLIEPRDSSGNPVMGIRVDGLLAWVAANRQTTVGAAGAASALPANPTAYLKVVDSSGTTLVVPAYAAV